MLLFSNIANFMQISNRKDYEQLLPGTQRQRSGPESGDFGPLLQCRSVSDPHVAMLLRMTERDFVPAQDDREGFRPCCRRMNNP